MIDLNALRVFAAVVEANSFSVAARKLRMPVATVSRRIAQLEEQLGVRLLDRTTRKLRLTDSGSRLLEHAQHAVELQNLLVAAMQDRSDSFSGLLRLAAPPSIAASLISPICCAFRRTHPNVRINVHFTERTVDLVGDGFDIAFHVGDLKDSSAVAKRILTYRHRVLASPDYLKGKKPLRAPNDLLDHPLFGFSRFKPDTLWRLTNADTGQVQQVRFQAQISMNDYQGIAHALIVKAGIGELPPIVEPQLFTKGRLVEVLPKWHLRTFNLSLVHVGDRHTTPLIRSFKDFAAAAAPQLFPELPV